MLELLHAAEIERIIQLQRLAVPEWLMRALSYLGPSAFLLGLVGAIYLCVDHRLGARLLLLYFASDTLSYLTKLSFHSPRPFWMDERVHAFEPDATSFGLPSGHSLVATSVWFMLASVVRRPWFAAVAGLVVLLVSWSRVWLGAHFISDVVAGWLLGALLLVCFCRSERCVGVSVKNSSFRLQIILTACITVAIVAAGLALHASAQRHIDPGAWPRFPAVARSFRSLGSYTGAILGLGVGLAMATRWARFNPSGPLDQRMLRILLVAAPGALYWFRPRHMLEGIPDAAAFSLLFIGCAGAAWAFTFLIPWFFLRIRLAEPDTATAFSESSAKPHFPSSPA